MATDKTAERGRVIGIGGVFFKSGDPDRLSGWYREQLGISGGAEGILFKWRPVETPDVEHCTVWSVFPANTRYFDPSAAPFLINYIVDDLDALLAKLDRSGPNAEIKREDHEYGRFAWVIDPDGNKIELWEPTPQPASR